MENEVSQKIVFFDGVCALCNNFVDFLIVADRKKKYSYAPLQGVTFTVLNKSHDTNFPDSVVFFTEGRFYTKSTAALKIVTGLGRWYLLFGLFFLVPSSIRDIVYDWIANHRYRWFGQKESCRLPSPEEKKLFLP